VTGYAVAVRAGLLVIVFLAIPVAFFLVVRSRGSDSDPALASPRAQSLRASSDTLSTS
jgi:hypothetical protein